MERINLGGEELKNIIMGLPERGGGGDLYTEVVNGWWKKSAHDVEKYVSDIWS